MQMLPASRSFASFDERERGEDNPLFTLCSLHISKLEAPDQESMRASVNFNATAMPQSPRPSEPVRAHSWSISDARTRDCCGSCCRRCTQPSRWLQRPACRRKQSMHRVCVRYVPRAQEAVPAQVKKQADTAEGKKAAEDLHELEVKRIKVTRPHASKHVVNAYPL